MLKFLKSKGIKEPTPIQAQGIPVACVVQLIISLMTKPHTLQQFLWARYDRDRLYRIRKDPSIRFTGNDGISGARGSSTFREGRGTRWGDPLSVGMLALAKKTITSNVF